MRGQWCYFDSYFNDSYCDWIITECNKLPKQSAKMGLSNSVEDTSFRSSNISFITKDMQQFSKLYDDIWRVGMWGNNDWFGFHLSQLDYIQFAEYRSENTGQYKRHQDTFWITDNQYHRKLTMVIQLTNPSEYDGGDLELYELDNYPSKEALRNRGTVIIFPSFTYHAALPVTRGVRHSLAVWFEGPKWR
jgi:PKHD-type hydroxylase